MARIQSALFGASKQPTLERYALLEKLGEGMLAESDALLALGRTADAVHVSAAATTRATSVFGTEHLSTAYALRSWGTALREHGQMDAATGKLRAAKSLFTRLGVTFEADKTGLE